MPSCLRLVHGGVAFFLPRVAIILLPPRRDPSYFCHIAVFGAFVRRVRRRTPPRADLGPATTARGVTKARRRRPTDRSEWVTREACEPYSVRSGQTFCWGANMGMSASDAAPLPRLGEIFFDVRGSSRSMRLSWYSDTGVAVARRRRGRVRAEGRAAQDGGYRIGKLRIH